MKNLQLSWTIQYPESYKCLYCDGDCPKDETIACDKYKNDVDGLYKAPEYDHHGCIIN